VTCPRCYAEFEPGHPRSTAKPGVCPDCGVQLLHNVSGMMKTSAVMISAAGEQGFYRSVQDVPEPLRRQLLQVTASENSGTIVIADKAGKEQLTQVVARREALPAAAAAKVTARPAHGAGSWLVGKLFPAQSFLGLKWIVWAGIFLACGSAGVVAAVFRIRW
jgi:hypothetical protein